MGEDDPEKWVVTEVREGKVKQYYIVRDSDKFILKDGVMLKTITNTVKDSAMEPVEPDTKTGDFNHIMRYVALLSAAVLLLVLFVLWRRRDR